MTINDLVGKIISERKKRLPVLQEKMTLLQNLQDAIDSFNYFKSEIVDANGNAIVGGKYETIIAKNPEVVSNLNDISTVLCQNAIDDAKKTLEEAIKRFERDRINISVVGHARIGKSKFLQSVSNLSDHVIPAFSEEDCTGAVSIIQNVPGAKLKAEITFKTEAEMVAIVQEYLNLLIPDPAKRLYVRTLNDIKNISLDVVSEKMEPGNVDNEKYPYLCKFVNKFDEWAECVKLREIVLYDEMEIETYVAQHNGKKNAEKIEYSKYLAVKTCLITCTFDYQEAGQITLIDTIGFGDKAVGIEDKLVDTIKDESDASIFMLFPYNKSGNGISSEIGKIYNRINESCGNKNLNNWLFWLINLAPNHPDTPNDMSRCKKALSTLESNRWHGAMRKIIDVSNQDQVREEFLIPLLSSLMGNLDEIDSLYLRDVQKALEKVKQEYISLCRCAQKVMQSEFKASMSTNMRAITENHRETITMQVFKLAIGKMLQLRDLPCDALKKDMSDIVASMKNSTLIPDSETLSRDIVYHQYQVETVLNTYCNYMRNDLTKKITDVDISLAKVVCDLKNEVTSILVSEDAGKLGRILCPDEEKELYEWLHDFSENYLDETNYPNLYYAFNNLYNFDFSVKGFLTYEVRACLDELDSAISGRVSCNLPAGATEAQMANWISHVLEIKLIDVAELLEKRMRELITRPNRAFFAVVREFSDQIRFAKGVENEWDALLTDNVTLLWKKEFDQIRKDQNTFKEWQAVLDGLLEYNSNTNKLLLS